MPRKLAAGNWKMNGLRADLAELEKLGADHAGASVDVLICLPATLICECRDMLFDIGGQDCHMAGSGAHTGDISAAMLADAGASHVILGHSERRTDHGESNSIVRQKAEAAHAAGLVAIICIGETLAQREAGQTLDLIADQLSHSLPDGATAANTVIAYEPVWAIGTGKVPTTEQIAEVHALLRKLLEDRVADAAGVRLLYGGSVKGSNAGEIFAIPHVDGALVGGASLKAADFSPIVSALEKA